MFYFIVGGILLILGCLCFVKKADFLFLRHRSMEDFEKEYDVNSARQITGLRMLILGFSFVLAGLYPSTLPLLVMGALIAVLVQKIGLNRYASYQGFLKTSTSTKKAAKPLLKGSTLFTIVVLIFSAFVMFMGSINIEINEKDIHLSATLTPSKTVEYKNIQSIAQKEDFAFGTRSFGVGNSKISSGKFRNDALGNYDLYAYANNTNVIIIKTKDGYVVFNQEDTKKTDAMFDKLKEKLEESKS